MSNNFSGYIQGYMQKKTKKKKGEVNFLDPNLTGILAELIT